MCQLEVKSNGTFNWTELQFVKPQNETICLRFGYLSLVNLQEIRYYFPPITENTSLSRYFLNQECRNLNWPITLKPSCTMKMCDSWCPFALSNLYSFLFPLALCPWKTDRHVVSTNLLNCITSGSVHSRWYTRLGRELEERKRKIR